MSRPKSIKTILEALTPNQIEQLRELLKENPRIVKLEKQLAVLDSKRESIIAEIEALRGGKTGAKRGRPAGMIKGKPGRPKKTDAPSVIATNAKRRGRPPKVKVTEVTEAPKKRGRPAKAGVSTPEMRAAAAKAVTKKERTPEQQAALNSRVVKTRAARQRKTSNE